MTETLAQRFERIQMMAVQKVARDMFLDCCEDLHDTDVREELIAVGRTGCRAAVIDMAPDYGVPADQVTPIADAVEIAFELEFCKLALSQMRGEA